jgi:hypothetical protein
MTFYIRLAFTTGLALRIKGAAYFTNSKLSETDNKRNEDTRLLAYGDGRKKERGKHGEQCTRALTAVLLYSPYI